jgi:CHAT domain-containing protein/Tfp pilus assembly protein PilF
MVSKIVRDAAHVMLLLTLSALTATAQVSPRTGASELLPAQTIERELAGAETHHYKVDLKADEFFQVRVEQKGVDVGLTLLDAGGGLLAAMDSPNGQQGMETLSFVAAKTGAFTLQVSGLDEKAGKGVYIIRREQPRPATARDRRRVEVERLFVEGLTAREFETAMVKLKAAQAGWQELADRSMSELTTTISKQFSANKTYADAAALADEGTLEASRSALSKLQEAHRLYVEIGARQSEAETLFWIGSVSDDLGEKDAALQSYARALALFHELGEKSWEASALNNVGMIHYRAGNLRKALDCYERSLLLLGADDDKDKKATTLSNIGGIYADLNEFPKALEYLQQALPLARAGGDRFVEARVQNNLGSVYSGLAEHQKALDSFEQALQIRRAIGDKEGEAITSDNIVRAKARYEEAQSKPETGPLPIGNMIERRLAGGNRGHTYKVALRRGQVLRVDTREREAGVSLMIFSIAGTQADPVAGADLSLGYGRETLTFVPERTGDYLVVVAPSGAPLGASYQLTAAVRNVVTQPDRERLEAERLLAEALDGEQEGSTTGLRGAAAKWEKSLPLWSRLGDKYWEGYTNNYLGMVYFKLGERRKALDSYQRALSLRKVAGDIHGEATTLSNIGTLYVTSGEKRKALEYYGQALTLFQQAGSKVDEAITLSNTGSLHVEFDEKQKALEYYRQALPLFTVIDRKNDEAIVLNNMGAIYYGLGEKQKALQNYKQALSIHREVGDKRGENKSLNNLALIYQESGDLLSAFVAYTQSLRLARAVGGRDDEVVTLSNMMLAWVQYGGNRRKAILFGKQAVNKYQELRSAAQGLDNETQKSLLHRAQNVYKDLAWLLIAEGRLEQAMQVLNLYQDQQFFDFDRALNSPVRQIALSAREQKFAKLYETAGDRVEQLSAQIDELEQRAGLQQPTPQETAQRQKLDQEMAAARKGFSTFLLAADKEFAGPPDEKDRVPPAPDVADMQTALRELNAATGQNTASLYTLIGRDKFYVLLVTAHGEVKAFESLIMAGDLNKKLLQFHALLRTPRYDPRQLGGDLYKIIFSPVEAELKKTGVRTLMWMLDGSLRYVPMAALWDGEKYMIERYQNVVLTRANSERMTRSVSRSWTGTGLGSSRAHTVEPPGEGDSITFSALPGVIEELESIFRTEAGKGNGILDGEVFSDGAFNKKAFHEAMKRRRPLVHISSHFSFRPGDHSRSFLLLGDGTVLTLSEMKQQGKLFEGVELLTLSACNTAATQSDSDGREIDGFAELAQRLGASAVLATLWQVSDGSTPWLMREFYRERQDRDGMTKAEALRKAQLALLNGTAKAKSLPGGAKDGTSADFRLEIIPNGAGQPRMTTRAEIVYVETRAAPPYQPEEGKPFAHPYFWSPFVLYGNGR